MIRFRRPRRSPTAHGAPDRGEDEDRFLFPPAVFTDANYSRGILLPNDDGGGPVGEVVVPIPPDYFVPERGGRDGNGHRRRLPALSRDEAALWGQGMAAEASARRRSPMEVGRLLGAITLRFDEKAGGRGRGRVVSPLAASREYSDGYDARHLAEGGEGVARRPAAAHSKFSRAFGMKRAKAEARSEMGIEDGDAVSPDVRRRLDARSQEFFDHWKAVKQSPPLCECWDREAGGFVREALGDDERHVPVVCLLDWMKGGRIADRQAGRTRSLYGGLRRVPTDARSVLESLLDLSCPTSLYNIPLITPYAVARRIAQNGPRATAWEVRIGVYMNRLLPEVLTAGTLHCVMSALDEGSYIVSEPLHVPPIGNGEVFESSKYPIVRLPGARCHDETAIIDLTEEDDAHEEKKEDGDATRDHATMGSTRETTTISPFTPKGLLKLMENTGNDVSMFPEIARSLAPYLKLDLMLHQQHAICWMTQMERLGGFGINSILWEEREFLDGGKYYYSPALGQIRLGRPPVTVGGCVADMMGLGKTLQMLSLIASSLDEIKREAREGGEHCTHATLIVVPPALVMQWCNEIKKSCGDAIKVGVLDANSKEVVEGLVGSGGWGNDILVTTYGALEKPATSRYLAGHKWGRIVLDEMQEIRSSTTTIAKNCESLDCHRRWMLSGTPIFEGIGDLRGELNFLRLVPYGAYSEDGFFDFSVTSHWDRHSAHGLETLRILGLLILRRSKDMTIRSTGQPIMEQRKLTVEVIPIAQSASERALYCWFEFLVSQELQRKTEHSDSKNCLKSRALCLRLLREICFSPVMINGGLGVSSQLKTLNSLVRNINSRVEKQQKQTEQHSRKKRESRKVMSPSDALRYLSQHEQSANVGENFVSEQQFSRGQGANARSNHAMERIEDQVKRAQAEVDEFTRKEVEAKRNRAKAYWHLALELVTTGALDEEDEQLVSVAPKWSSLWKWRQSCIIRKERDDEVSVALCLQRGWRPSSAFSKDLLAANPSFAWAHPFSLRLKKVPPQVSIGDIKSAVFEASKKEPRIRLKLEQLHKSLNKASEAEGSRIQSDIDDMEAALQEAISYDRQLQPPTVIECTGYNSSTINENWMAYVQVSEKDVQQQLIRQADSKKGITLKSTDAVPHIEAALIKATECFHQAVAEQNVHPCAANKKKRAEAKKALEKAKLGLTINFDSTSSSVATSNVIMSRSVRRVRGMEPQTRSALVEAASTAIAKNTNSLATARSRLEAGRSTLTRLLPALDRGVSQDIAQKSAFETLESLRTNDFESTMCPICQCSFGSTGGDTAKPIVAMTTCGHFFCISCLDHHIHIELGKNKPVACPVCRAGFNPSFDVIHIDHLANDDEENGERRSTAKAKVREASEMLATSEGVLDAELWHSLFLSIDVPTHVSSTAHHLHTALPRDALAHLRAATEMKLDCARLDKPQNWMDEVSLQHTHAGLSSKIQALLRDLPLGEHAVVFSSSKGGVLHLETVVKAKGISCFSLFTGQKTKTTEESVSSWDSTKADASKAGPVLVVQAGAAASGLTLIRSSKLFLLEPFSRQEEEQQAYARLHRYGQKKDVHVKIYYAPVSIESRLLFWRKRSAEKMTTAGNSSSYVFTQQLFEGEEEEDDAGDKFDFKEDMTDSAALSREEEEDEDSMIEENSAEVGEDNIRTQFLLGLVDQDGNPTAGLEGGDHTNDVDQQNAPFPRASARRFILD